MLFRYLSLTEFLVVGVMGIQLIHLDKLTPLLPAWSKVPPWTSSTRVLASCSCCWHMKCEKYLPFLEMIWVVSMVSPAQFWLSSFPNIESSDQMITGKKCWRMWPPLQERAVPVIFFYSIQCFSFSSEKSAGLTSFSETTQKPPELGSKGQPERRCHGGLWQGPAGMQLTFL